MVDPEMQKQLEKIRDGALQQLMEKCRRRLELLGPRAGKLLNSRYHLYEWKNNRPPLRVYYRVFWDDSILMIFYELKTSEAKQRQTIAHILSRFGFRILYLLDKHTFLF